MVQRTVFTAYLACLTAATIASAQDEVVLSGRITDPHGNPVADVYVDASGPGQSGDTQTSADGTYSLTLAPGEYWLHILPPIGSPWTRQTLGKVEVTENTTLDIVLEEGRILSVLVVDAEARR